MLRQLLPEGASGNSGLLTRGSVVTSICRPGELEILHRWCSTCISACGYAGTAPQLLPEGSWRCLREFSNLDTCIVEEEEKEKCWSVSLSFCLSICSFVCPSVCLYFSLSVCLCLSKLDTAVHSSSSSSYLLLPLFLLIELHWSNSPIPSITTSSSSPAAGPTHPTWPPPRASTTISS